MKCRILRHTCARGLIRRQAISHILSPGLVGIKSTLGYGYRTHPISLVVPARQATLAGGPLRQPYARVDFIPQPWTKNVASDIYMCCARLAGQYCTYTAHAGQNIGKAEHDIRASRTYFRTIRTDKQDMNHESHDIDKQDKIQVKQG
jgi:hypothetical protein